MQPPTLVVCGEHTKSIPPDMARTIAERLPTAQVEVMAGVGHFGPQEDPDRAVESMLRFAARTALPRLEVGDHRAPLRGSLRYGA